MTDVQTTPNVEPAWTDGIPDQELRGYVQNKGFKDPGALADSYRNLEKLMGAPREQLLKLPDRDDAPEWGDVWKRLGRPEKPEEYGLQFDGDGEFANRFARVFHEANIPKPAAAKLNAEWNNYVSEMIKAEDDQLKLRDEREIGELKNKWGAEFEKHTEYGRRAGREFGLSEEDFSSISRSLGPGKTLELFHRIGSKVGEAKAFDPNGAMATFGVTREQARAELARLQTDRDFVAKYLGGDKSAQEKMESLSKIASS